MKVGVLALQGDFERHAAALRACGADSLYIKKPQELASVAALVLPGGESTTLLKLLYPEFRQALIEYCQQGHPVLATCAGLILLAKEVLNPVQESLGLIDVTIERNAYGSQRDSFIAPALTWGATTLPMQHLKHVQEGVFIRAPKITRTGEAVEILLTHDEAPVLVRQDNVLGATFHPELSGSNSAVYDLFLKKHLD